MSTRVAPTSAHLIRLQAVPAISWAIAVWIAAALFAVLMSIESIRHHHAFETGFDTAIYDQALWLLANGHEPFSTITSRPALADHFTPTLTLLTPLYWLGLGVTGLLVTQAVGMALTAPALFALARTSGASPTVASIPALLWLAPWTAAGNLFNFRPEGFGPVLLVLTVIAAKQQRHVLLAVTVVLALGLKEDVSLTYVVLGVLLAFHGLRRIGVVVAVTSGAWFVVASAIMQALAGSYDAFGRRFAGDRGDSVSDAFAWMARHPVETAGDVVGQSGITLLLLVLSTGGLALLAPSWILLSAPTALHNALSAYEPQHGIGSHYHLVPLAGLFIAAAIGAGRLRELGGRGRLAVTVGVASAAAAAVIGGVMFFDLEKEERVDTAATRRLLERIPPHVPVSAAPRLLPHLSRRIEIYSLPEPFVPLDWGSPLTRAEMAERAERVRFVAYVEGHQLKSFFTGDIADVREMLVRDGFVVVARTGPLQILERR